MEFEDKVKKNMTVWISMVGIMNKVRGWKTNSCATANYSSSDILHLLAGGREIILIGAMDRTPLIVEICFNLKFVILLLLLLFLTDCLKFKLLLILFCIAFTLGLLRIAI